MRRLIPLLIAVTVLGAFLWTLRFLYQQSVQPEAVHQTASPEVGDVIKKTVASGAIVPRNEVVIKPRVSGIVDKLWVQPGQTVKRGDPLARIEIIPNVVSLNAAEARLEASRITLKNAQAEHQRVQRLRTAQLVSEGDYNRALLELRLAEQEEVAAKNNLELVRHGAIRGSGKVSNLVRSAVDGMVIEVPIELGTSVIEANTFNEGTTIAAVADMNDMIFEGNVDESEVGQLREGMPLEITVGALDDVRFEGKLEYISPKGLDNEGTIEFEIRAGVRLDAGHFVRANYSANAQIILSERKEVLRVAESWLQFDEQQRAFVELEVGPQQFEKRYLELGLTDGIFAEVLGGLELGNTIRVPTGQRSSAPAR